MRIKISHLIKMPKSTIMALLVNRDTSISPGDHIRLGIEWLSKAQDAGGNGGVSIRYSLLRGWESPYPETTGYIIPTFLNYHHNTGCSEYRQRAIDMANWELSIQKGDGSVKGWSKDGDMGSLVFDTGQVIFGLVSIYAVTKEDRFIEGAIKAGNWLVEVQDNDGAWRKFSYNAIPHSYYSRVSWALAELFKVTMDRKYERAAMKNIEWVLSNQLLNGWYRMAGFTEDSNDRPITHTIAYTIRGVLETGICLDVERYIMSAKKAADAILQNIEPDGFFWSEFNPSWAPANKKYSCLTGNAQLAIIFLRLYRHTGDSRYLAAGKLINRYLKRHQIIETRNEDIRGAISGSYPIWGSYEPLSFPNWATKFFVDSLLLEDHVNLPYRG